MRRMKYKIGAFCLLAIGLWGCLEDKGVYDYDFDVAPEIKIDTVGTFTPSLTLGRDKEREDPEEGGSHRNAQSIFIGGVNFRVDREMVRNISERCQLERAPWKKQRSSNKFTSEQRLALALKYLDEHPFLTVWEYRKLTGLLQTAATNELRQWGHQPDSGIEITGRGAHRVYIKKK